LVRGQATAAAATPGNNGPLPPNGLKPDCREAEPYLSWLSLFPLRLNKLFTGRLSRAAWHVTQVRTPGSARRRAGGISSPHSRQWVSLSPAGMRERARMTPSMTVSSI
jgi:hypothetical protein